MGAKYIPILKLDVNVIVKIGDFFFSFHQKASINEARREVSFRNTGITSRAVYIGVMHLKKKKNK